MKNYNKQAKAKMSDLQVDQQLLDDWRSNRPTREYLHSLSIRTLRAIEKLLPITCLGDKRKKVTFVDFIHDYFSDGIVNYERWNEICPNRERLTGISLKNLKLVAKYHKIDVRGLKQQECADWLYSSFSDSAEYTESSYLDGIRAEIEAFYKYEQQDDQLDAA